MQVSLAPLFRSRRRHPGAVSFPRRRAAKPQGAASAGLLLALAALCGPALSAQNRLLDGDHPKVLYFRWPEIMANRGTSNLPRWRQLWTEFHGGAGKALDEEIPGLSLNRGHLADYVSNYPDRPMLLHYNASARDPRDLTPRPSACAPRPDWFAGHWLHFVGTDISGAVAANRQTLRIPVLNSAVFRMNYGLNDAGFNDDITLVKRRNGQLDWSTAEQVRLVAIHGRNEIEVERARYGSCPLSFGAGDYAAPHVVQGPWGNPRNPVWPSVFMWEYNFSTRSPARDFGGGVSKRCVDVLVDELVDLLTDRNKLGFMAGITLDVARWQIPHLGRRLDVDGDGVADDGYFGGVNTYGVGQVEFLKKLRQRLDAASGGTKLILADAQENESQRGARYLNGMESEGFPIHNDPLVTTWSSARNRLLFYDERAAQPRLNYVVHKINNPPPLQPGEHEYARHAMVLATATIHGAAWSSFVFPPGHPDESWFELWESRAAVWDEAWAGTARTPGYLGQPIGGIVELGRQSPDVLAGSGQSMSSNFLARLEGARFDLQNGTQPGSRLLRVTPTQTERRGPETISTIVIKDVPTNGPDLLVTTTMRALPRPGYSDPDIPRLFEVSIGEGWRLDGARLPEDRGTELSGGQRLGYFPDGARFNYLPALTLAGETHEAYSLHPPYQNGVRGSIWFAREMTVPAGGVLSYYSGIEQPDRTDSDGVRFQVWVQRSGGTRELVAEVARNTYGWRRELVDLQRWAGEQVKIECVVDSGPRNNPVRDACAFGDVGIVRLGAPQGSEPRLPCTNKRMLLRGSKRFVPLGNGALVDCGVLMTAAGSTRRGVRAHPPYSRVTGQVRWNATLRNVSEDQVVAFDISMRDQQACAFDVPDGVLVIVRGRPAGSSGASTELYREIIEGAGWRPRSFSIAAFASANGVDLEFIVDPRGRNNPVCDLVYFGDLRVVDMAELRPEAAAVQTTWVDRDWCNASFYAPRVASPTVDITLRIEGDMTWFLRDVTVHAAPDVLMRQFENGVVVANPALHPVDIRSGLRPGLTRFMQTGMQNTDNDGQAVGRSLRLRAQDGAFLRGGGPIVIGGGGPGGPGSGF